LSLARLKKLSKPFPNARMSMKKMVGSTMLSCSFAIMASLVAYMQHTDEQ